MQSVLIILWLESMEQSIGVLHLISSLSVYFFQLDAILLSACGLLLGLRLILTVFFKVVLILLKGIERGFFIYFFLHILKRSF